MHHHPVWFLCRIHHRSLNLQIFHCQTPSFELWRRCEYLCLFYLSFSLSIRLELVERFAPRKKKRESFSLTKHIITSRAWSKHIQASKTTGYLFKYKRMEFFFSVENIIRGERLWFSASDCPLDSQNVFDAHTFKPLQRRFPFNSVRQWIGQKIYNEYSGERMHHNEINLFV